MRLISQQPREEFDLTKMFESARSTCPGHCGITEAHHPVCCGAGLIIGRQRKRCDIRVPVTVGNRDVPTKELSTVGKSSR